MIYGVTRRELGVGGCLTLKQSGWLYVCLFSLEAGLPSALFPHYFPRASIILFLLIYSHCSRQTKEKEQWWNLGC